MDEQVAAMVEAVKAMRFLMHHSTMFAVDLGSHDSRVGCNGDWFAERWRDAQVTYQPNNSKYHWEAAVMVGGVQFWTLMTDAEFARLYPQQYAAMRAQELTEADVR